MNREDRNQSRRHERRRQICQGALRLFREKGFHGTSMREIARASDIGLGNIYNYFKKKEDILYRVHSNILDQLLESFGPEDEAGGDAREHLVRVMRNVFKVSSRIKDEILFMYTETKSLDKKARGRLLHKEAEFVAAFETIIRRGVDQGVFHCPDPDISANLIVLCLAVTPLRGWNILPRHQPDNLLEALIRFIMQGLGESPDWGVDPAGRV
ncbi:MAG: TetR/AcrR family transcriptional regulator [Proteobacteria bacterium]|nr:TetR/AcrR family transcriptional regulator [Pseudomonadota bacterium]